MSYLYQLLFLVATYFIAAIPFGLLVTKKYLGQDVRKSGSGNIGATNVARVAGKKLGALTLVLDALKGMIMVILARFFFDYVYHLHLFLVLVCAVAVLAHIYPIYLDYKGGKGVATAIAVLLALDPAVGFLAIVFWIMAFLMFRISAIASMSSILSAIFTSLHYDAPSSQVVLCIFLFILITIRHKENILRILMGEENKM